MRNLELILCEPERSIPIHLAEIDHCVVIRQHTANLTIHATDACIRLKVIVAVAIVFGVFLNPSERRVDCRYIRIVIGKMFEQRT